MDIVRDIQKNYLLPCPPRTIGEKIAEARQQSGTEKLKGHDIMALQKPLKEYMMCSLYASVQSIEISPFLPHGAVNGLRLHLC
jgi:hypothetical protein